MPLDVEVLTEGRVVRNVWADVSPVATEYDVFEEPIGGSLLSVVPAVVTDGALVKPVVLSLVVFDSVAFEVVATKSVDVVLGRESVIVGVSADVPVSEMVFVTPEAVVTVPVVVVAAGVFRLVLGPGLVTLVLSGCVSGVVRVRRERDDRDGELISGGDDVDLSVELAVSAEV